MANGSGAFKKHNRKKFLRRYPAAMVPPTIFHGWVSAKKKSIRQGVKRSPPKYVCVTIADKYPIAYLFFAGTEWGETDSTWGRTKQRTVPKRPGIAATLEKAALHSIFKGSIEYITITAKREELTFPRMWSSIKFKKRKMKSVRRNKVGEVDDLTLFYLNIQLFEWK